MDTPSSIGDSSTAKVVTRPSMMDSMSCGLSSFSGVRIDKDELRQRIIMPEYLRFAIRDCINRSDAESISDQFLVGLSERHADLAPETPMVVFINPRSGGRLGPVLMERLQDLMGFEQVFDLLDVKPHQFVQYGLGCLETLASKGDECAKVIRQKLRVVVAGGDGTVGWVLGSLGELNKQGRIPVPPVAIIPLGTGNDLSRSFSWGGSFPYAWKTAIKRTLQRASVGPTCRLDSWQILISMPSEETIDPPNSLKPTEERVLNQDLDFEAEMPLKVNSYEGVFYNYLSIGMDAQVAYDFHQLRNEKPYLAQGPISNKIIYSSYSCSQGWFLTPCISDPSLRGLKSVLKMHIKRLNSTEWESIPIPKSVRSIVALNLHNYGSGRNPWGNLKPEYLEKKGFVEANADDGLLEIFGLKQGWHASFVMVELISAKHIAQAAEIRLEIRGGDWKDGYMQMDGEPWKQPMSKDFSTFVEIKRVPFQSEMVCGDISNGFSFRRKSM